MPISAYTPLTSSSYPLAFAEIGEIVFVAHPFYIDNYDFF